MAKTARKCAGVRMEHRVTSSPDNATVPLAM